MWEWENQNNNAWLGSKRPRKTSNDIDEVCKMWCALVA